MVLWRISNYADLDGTGGLICGGRWHSKGRPIVYCTLNPATALLEVLVHLEIDAEDRPENFQVLKIEGPETLSQSTLKAAHLPPQWATEPAATRAIGDAWLASQRSLLLKVPSVLVPETWNVLVNPAHPELNLLRIVNIYQHPFDTRLV